MRACVVCGKPVPDPEPGIDYCSHECFQEDAVGNHEKFQGQLSRSQKAVEVVAAWMRNWNFSVRVPEMTVAQTASDWKKHADAGDVYFRHEARDEEKRVEVKHRGLEFHDERSFPFPTAIVCQKLCHDRSNPKPYAYVLVNKSMTHVAIAKHETEKEWTVRKMLHPVYQDYEREYYLCPTGVMRFAKID